MHQYPKFEVSSFTRFGDMFEGVLNFIRVTCSGAGSNLKVGGTNFLLCPSTFSWCPGHYRKVQGTVTKTEQSLTFQGHAVSKVTLPTDRAWVVSYRSSISCSVSKILHVNLQTYFGQLRGDLGSHFGSWSPASGATWTPA